MPETLEELRARLTPTLDIVFLRHGTPPARAAEIVADTWKVLARKRKDIENPDTWVLAMVERQLALEARR